MTVMTKVEELREQLVRCTIDACLSCENSKDCESYACILTGHDEVDSNREIEHEKATAMAVQLVDALIAAVREEEREKCANYMLWRRDELEEAAGIDPKEGQHD